MGMSWKALEGAGVRRCCATFSGGKRCRRRAVVDVHGAPTSWCERHAWITQYADDTFVRGQKAEAQLDDDDDDDEGA